MPAAPTAPTPTAAQPTAHTDAPGATASPQQGYEMEAKAANAFNGQHLAKAAFPLSWDVPPQTRLAYPVEIRFPTEHAMSVLFSWAYTVGRAGVVFGLRYQANKQAANSQVCLPMAKHGGAEGAVHNSWVCGRAGCYVLCFYNPSSHRMLHLQLRASILNVADWRNRASMNSRHSLVQRRLSVVKPPPRGGLEAVALADLHANELHSVIAWLRKCTEEANTELIASLSQRDDLQVANEALKHKVGKVVAQVTSQPKSRLKQKSPARRKSAPQPRQSGRKNNYADIKAAAAGRRGTAPPAAQIPRTRYDAALVARETAAHPQKPLFERHLTRGVPPALAACITFLSAPTSLQEVGLFRVSGSKSDIQMICERTQKAENQGTPCVLQGALDPAAVCGALRLHMKARSLPLSRKDAVALGQASCIDDPAQRLAAGVQVVQSLHNDERATLKALVDLFGKIIDHPGNQMTTQNLCISIGITVFPAVANSAKLLGFLLSNKATLWTTDL